MGSPASFYLTEACCCQNLCYMKCREVLLAKCLCHFFWRKEERRQIEVCPVSQTYATEKSSSRCTQYSWKSKAIRKAGCIALCICYSGALKILFQSFFHMLKIYHVTNIADTDIMVWGYLFIYLFQKERDSKLDIDLCFFAAAWILYTEWFY